MKTLSCWFWKSGSLGSLALLIFATLTRADLPVIESIRVGGTNLIVTARVPAGHVRVTLESLDSLARGAWVPLAVQRLNGQGGVITFDLPRSGSFAVLRIRADASEPLPGFFYGGTNEFAPQPASGTRGGFSLFGPGTPTDSGSGSASREVVESDIWRLDGDTLYFFNQHRGLQVIDVTDPDAAVLRGALNLPAAGEQMYLLRSNRVVLLTQNLCGGNYGYPDSQILIVMVSNGVPSVEATLTVTGTITESRLAGDALYVAAQSLRPKPGSNGSTWEWGTQLSSFDLAVPNAPAARSTLWFEGYGNVIHATDTYLFAVTQNPTNYQKSIVNVIDITAPDGTMRPYDTITPAGRVEDKFKLDWTDAIFSVISEVSSSPRRTKLETFRLPDPRTVPPFSYLHLGEVELGHGERLFATRFDYPRVYVVTFLQIDPLWIVDLGDPTNPKVSGELQVPGWSTYIHSRGNQLVTVGIETNRTTISLFDVADPRKPALLSRVPLGSQYSYSEANQDERAFTVLEEASLILLPVQGYTTNGYESWVQLIDLGENSLTRRGRIANEFAPRRATMHRDRIISVSGVELLSVDATDRDHPDLKGRLELAWPINRVLLAGDYLIEITTGYFENVYRSGFWSVSLAAQPVVRVASAAQPDKILGTLQLTNAPIAGATVRGNRLYLAQAINASGVILGGETNSPPPKVLWLSVVDLANLPELAVIAETAVATKLLGWNGELEPVWPKPDMLVWVGGGSDYWYGPLDCGFVGGWYWPYWQSVGGGRLFAFDVSSDASPKFLSELDLTANGWWSFSRPFVTGSLVYLSHQAFVEFTVTNVSGGVMTSTVGMVVDWPTGYQRSFLDVVDYTDPVHPTVRKPISIPGELQGISHGGALLYTIGFHCTSTNFYQGYEALDASAYDGAEAHLVDSLSLSNVYPNPAVVIGTNLFLGRGQNYYVDGTTPATLETWALSSTGNFTELGSVKLPAVASELASFPGLLAAQVDWSRVTVFDCSNPAALRQVGEGPAAGCLYFNLRRADAALARTLWLPLDSYGVTCLSLSP